MRPEDVPRVRELSAEIAGYGPESLDEGDVYSHLASFFDRYYRTGTSPRSAAIPPVATLPT